MRIAAVLAACLLLLGCAGSEPEERTGDSAAPSTSAPTAAPPGPGPADTAAPDEGVVIDVTIAAGQVTPRGERVEVRVGDPVTLKVTSDAADELHVHADPEHTFDVVPGQDQSFTFTIDRPGQVAVESHHQDRTIAQLVVRR